MVEAAKRRARIAKREADAASNKAVRFRGKGQTTSRMGERDRVGVVDVAFMMANAAEDTF
jgi:hypothetical protein